MSMREGWRGAFGNRRTPRGRVWGLTVALAIAAWASVASAEDPDAVAATGPRVAVLDFELYDLTGLPATPQELERTGGLRGLLERALAAGGTLRPVTLDPAASAAANRGFGYLYDHPDAAAELGRAAGADWVLIGRLHKPSFLFAYLIVRPVETATAKALPDLIVEAKGQTRLVTERGALRLAEQVRSAIAPVRAP